MTPAEAFLVRIQDHAGALERVLSVLRRKYLGAEKISLLPGPPGVHEILLRISPEGSPSDRVRAELESLVDVREVRGLGGTDLLESRELALVRVRPGTGPFLGSGGRVLEEREDGDLLEITGAPHEVDAALADLRQRGVLNGFHRSGEVPAPRHSPYSKEQ